MQEKRLKDELRTSMYMDLFPMVRTDDIPESDMANAVGLPKRPTAMVVVPLSRVLVGTFQDMRQACEDLVDAWTAATANTRWEDSCPVCLVRGAYGDRRKAVLGLVCADESELLAPGEWGSLLKIDRMPDLGDMVDALAASVARLGLTSRVQEATEWRLGNGISVPLPAEMWSVDVTWYPELGTARLGLITNSAWMLLAQRDGTLMYRPWRARAEPLVCVETLVRHAVSVVERLNGGGKANICLLRGSSSRVFVTLDSTFGPMALDDLPHELSQAKDDPVVVRWVQDRLKAGEPVDAGPSKPATMSIPLRELLRDAYARYIPVREVLDDLYNRVMAARRLSDGFSCDIDHASLVLTEDSGRSIETSMADALITLLGVESDWLRAQSLPSLSASAWRGRLFHHAAHGWWLHLETDRGAMLAQTMAPKGIADELCAAGQVCMSVAGAPDYRITLTEHGRVATVTPERCSAISPNVSIGVGADRLVLEWLSDYDPAHVDILAEYLEHEAMLAREAADQPED